MTDRRISELCSVLQVCSCMFRTRACAVQDSIGKGKDCKRKQVRTDCQAVSKRLISCSGIYLDSGTSWQRPTIDR